MVQTEPRSDYADEKIHLVSGVHDTVRPDAHTDTLHPIHPAGRGGYRGVAAGQSPASLSHNSDGGSRDSDLRRGLLCQLTCAASTNIYTSSPPEPRCQDQVKKTGHEGGRSDGMDGSSPWRSTPHPLVQTTNDQDSNQHNRDLEAGTAEAAAPGRAPTSGSDPHTVVGVP
ncbi:hypothetical protein SprV_0702428500 [Sparganum proliferum]